VRLLVLLSLLTACNPPPEPKVGKTLLVMADGTVPAPTGGTVVELPGTVPANVSGTVQLAVAGDVPWKDVLAAMRAVTAAGAQPVFLVGHRDSVEALPPIVLDGADHDDTMRLRAYTDGRSCVVPPGTDVGGCVSRKDGSTHIDRVFVRQLMHQAVRDYRLKKVQVVIPDASLAWADVVRSIDGARTCCSLGDDPVTVEVTVAP
jgi:hypothetical protein